MRKLIYIAALLTLASCEFEIDNVDLGRRLYVKCLPAAGEDSTCIEIQNALPLITSLDESTEPASPSVKVTVNGKERDAVRKYYSSGELTNLHMSSHSICYKFPSMLSAGDMVKITISADGVETVTSECIVPKVAEKPQTRLRTEQGLDLMDIILSDDGSEDCYEIIVTYAASHQYWMNDVPPYVANEDIPKPQTDPEKMYLQGLWMINLQDHLYGEKTSTVNEKAPFPIDINQLLVKSDGFENGQRIITINYQHHPKDHYHEDFAGDRLFHWQSDQYFYRVMVTRYGPEYYYYLKSRAAVENNELGSLGWAPAYFAWTNVENGLGLMTGTSVAISDWIPNVWE